MPGARRDGARWRVHNAGVFPSPGTTMVMDAMPRRAFIRFFLLAGLGLCALPVLGQNGAPPLRFGILPTGGPAESSEDWQPVLDDMSKALKRPVIGVSVSTYEGMYRAVLDRRVDVAFLSGKLALDSVLAGKADVVVQLARPDGAPGYRALLLARKDGPIRDLNDVFSNPKRWTYARGETVSVSGYLVPEAQLFVNRKVSSETYFKSVKVDNHQNNALAVANGEVDLCSNNSADMERFAAKFPRQYAQLRVLWTSKMIPHGVLVTARDLPEVEKEQVRRFLLGYARGGGAEAAAQLEHLQRVHKLAGFVAARDTVLLPFAQIEAALELQRARDARWVDEDARQSRMARINAELARKESILKAGDERAAGRQSLAGK